MPAAQDNRQRFPRFSKPLRNHFRDFLKGDPLSRTLFNAPCSRSFPLRSVRDWAGATTA